MADLSQLAKQLQEQVDLITQYLEKEKIPPPTFMPEGGVLKPSMAGLPSDIEQVRAKAHALSWNISQLLTSPVTYVM
jgi:hypothetical protein